MSDQLQYSIGEVSRRAGARPSAIRFYERVGLIAPPRRASRRRVYDARVFESLALIQLAQDAGFTIEEIKLLLSGFDPETTASARWRALTRAKIEEMTARIERAERMRAMLERLSQCRCETLAECVESRVAGLRNGKIGASR